MASAQVQAALPAPVPALSQYESRYDPKIILNHPEFKILNPANDSKVLDDKEKNIACTYNEKHEVSMVNKPRPTAGKGECVVHVHATGICG
jgi:L-iditol 2-dehydrogenase